MPISGSEGRFFCESFRSGINHFGTDLVILGPVRDQSPMKVFNFESACVGDNRDWLRWCDIVPRNMMITGKIEFGESLG